MISFNIIYTCDTRINHFLSMFGHVIIQVPPGFILVLKLDHIDGANVPFYVEVLWS